jgi:hypothetical protein
VQVPRLGPALRRKGGKGLNWTTSISTDRRYPNGEVCTVRESRGCRLCEPEEVTCEHDLRKEAWVHGLVGFGK